MPIYQYCCGSCGKIREVIEKVNQKKYHEDLCECGSVMRRIMSRNTFKLKGGGWPGQENKTPLHNDFDPEMDKLVDEVCESQGVK